MLTALVLQLVQCVVTLPEALCKTQDKEKSKDKQSTEPDKKVRKTNIYKLHIQDTLFLLPRSNFIVKVIAMLLLIQIHHPLFLFRLPTLTLCNFTERGQRFSNNIQVRSRDQRGRHVSYVLLEQMPQP